MKQIALFLITLYQRILSPLVKQVIGTAQFCRFSPSCSAYAKQVVQQYGVIKGSYLAAIRLLRCQSFSKAL